MANTYIYQMSDTWSNSAQTYVGIGMDVVDSGSTANSALLNMSVGGANQFTVYKSGDAYISGGIGANTTYTNFLPDGIIMDYNPSASLGRIMVGQSDGLTFYAGNSATAGNTTVLMTISNTGVTSMGNATANVQLGGITVLGTPSVVAGYGNSNSSIDMVVTNANTGGNTSADFAAYDTSGLTSPNFIDMGINGNTWSAAFWTINGPSDGYLYTGNTNLSIGAAGNGYVNFFTGGTLAVNERMRITNTSITMVSNTLTLGTSSATAANGYSWLPNGLKVNYGWIAANSSVGNATFTSAFSTACLHVLLTPVSSTATGPYLIQPANTTVAPIRTTSTAAASNVAYFAIGY